jgi:hypothetical protein
MALLKLVVNRAAGTLVRSQSNPASFVIPPLVQGDTLSLEVSVVEDNPTAGIGRVSYVSLGGYSLKIGIGAEPKGDGSITPFALETSFTLNTEQIAFTGTLALTATALTTWLGTSASKQGWLEVELYDTSASRYETVYGGPVQIRAQLLAVGSTVALPTDYALGAAQAAATYVRKVGAAGESIILTSANGTKQVLLYVDDDGSFHADPL